MAQKHQVLAFGLLCLDCRQFHMGSTDTMWAEICILFLKHINLRKGLRRTLLFSQSLTWFWKSSNISFIHFKTNVYTCWSRQFQIRLRRGSWCWSHNSKALIKVAIALRELMSTKMSASWIMLQKYNFAFVKHSILQRRHILKANRGNLTIYDIIQLPERL